MVLLEMRSGMKHWNYLAQCKRKILSLVNSLWWACWMLVDTQEHLNQGIEFTSMLGRTMWSWVCCKCVNVEMVWHVFVSVSNKGFSSWNSTILVLDTNGFEDDAIKLFTSLQCSILIPDSDSFIVVVTACNHSRLVDKEKYYFQIMKMKYGI